MSVDTAGKRASALAGLNHPYLRLVMPDGSTDRAASLGMYNGFIDEPPAPDASYEMICLLIKNGFRILIRGF